MRKQSWDSLEPSCSRYHYTQQIRLFVTRVHEELQPLALILFGSLAKGDFHERSDADFCVILPGPLRSPFEGYDRVVACDPSGIVQPLVYDREQFCQMIDQANGLALEVMADGIFLAGDEGFRRQIEGRARRVHERFGIERTATGWRLARLST